MNNYYNTFDPGIVDRRLLILDWASIGYQTLHGLASQIKRIYTSSLNPLNSKTNLLSTRKGTVHAYRNSHMSRILEHIKIFNPTDIIIALEGDGNWRYDVYPEYKATRKFSEWKFLLTRKDFGIERDILANDVANIIGATVIKVDNSEGDDIIARAVELNYAKYDQVVVSSSDKDMIQLTKFNNVKIYNSKNHTYDNSAVDVSQFIETKIMQGDTSDNILGMLLPGKKRRVGPATARALYESSGGDLHALASKDGWLDQYMLNKRLIDMDMIPVGIKLNIDKVLMESEISYCDYVTAYSMGFSEQNMSKLNTLRGMQLKLFTRGTDV